MRPENSQETSARRPSAVKSMWSMPPHCGAGIECISFIVCGERKSRRRSRSATTIARRPSAVKYRL